MLDKTSAAASPKDRPSTETLYETVFRKALLIRLTEDRIVKLYPSDVVQSPVHLSNGQEIVAAAACAALRTEDRVFSSYRSHAFYLAKGGDLNKMFAELCGRLTGDAKGKAGSMHLTSPEVNFMGSSAIVASTIPHAVGAAYASRHLKEDRVHLAVFGDGATEEGVYHETLNLAALHKLPVIFLCEDNGLAVHTRPHVRHSYNIETHAKAYGLPTTHVKNGMDIEAVYDAVSMAVEAARNGKGPQFVLVETYRYKEHVGCGEDYNAGYRTQAELDPWLARDPLIQDKPMLARFKDEVEQEIDAAVKFALESPFPTAADLSSDVDVPDAKATYNPKDFIGKLPDSPLKYYKAIFLAMERTLTRNGAAIIMGQGADDHKGIFGTTTGLPQKFGKNRIIDTPIAEDSVTGFSLGMSLGGMYPIVTHIRTDFTLLASNQIINLIGKYRYMYGGCYEAPMLIRCVIGRGWGQGAQHSQSLQSMYAHIPGLTVVMPSDSQAILETYSYIAEKYRGPVMSFEHRLLYDFEFQLDEERLSKPIMPLASRLIRQGKDVTIVATSIMTLEARRAADYLKETAGIECEIIDLHCVSHPDEKMILDSVAKTGKLIVADTSWIPYGVAAEVCRIVASGAPQSLKVPVVSIGMNHSPCPTAKTLEDMFYPNLSNVVDRIATIVTGKSDHKIPLPDNKTIFEVSKHFKGPF